MRPLALGLVVLVLSGCGSGGSPHVSASQRERDWTIGAALLLDQLDEALTRVSRAGVGRVTLDNASTLYEALLGYTFLGGCGKVLANLGPPPPSHAELRNLLRRGCVRLEHASSLFTRAVQRESSPLLVAAASEALGTATLLRRARELVMRFETRASQE
jgi:uncharacterized protein YceK